MNASRHAIPLLLLLACAACERSSKPPRGDSSRAVPASSAVPVESAPVRRPPASSWDAAAGPVLIVRADSPGRAYVVYPQYSDSTLPDTMHFDVAPLRDARVELYGHSGALGATQVRSVGPRSWRAGECIEWPTATVAASSDSASAGWSVALLPSGISGVTLDSIEGLSPLDSAKLAADITRLVSALPGDTSRAFRGIPFAVRNAYRFTVDSSTSAIAADVVRKLNQEAMPLEEHTFLIAERRGSKQRYDVVYTDRTSGTEESLVTTELLAAVRLPSSPSPRTALVLLREGSDTNAYSLLERTRGGNWRVTWTSVRTGC
ncbi:MAG TPA: hypothetical protein VIP79_06880 [Gemmatimonadaceae bacterium]